MLGDSLLKHLNKIKGVDIWSSPGINIRNTIKLLENPYVRQKMCLSERDTVILAVGTNTIADYKKEGEIQDKPAEEMMELVHLIKQYTDAHIIVSAILPRIVDFRLTNHQIKHTNNTLRNILKKTDNTSFWVTYKPFWNGHYIKSDLFIMTNTNRHGKLYADGVHLNMGGIKILRQYIRQRVGQTHSREIRQRWGITVLIKWRHFVAH